MSTTPLTVTRAAVARFLLDTQALTPPVRAGDTPDAVLAEMRRLECVQLDPVAAVERNQHLALGARLEGYRPALLNELLATGRVFEYIANAACVIPMEDYPIFAGTRHRIASRLTSHLAKLRPVTEEIRHVLTDKGAQPARAFVSAHRVRGYWDASGTATMKATSHALNMMLDAGDVMVVRREGNTRYFDLPAHTLPPALFDEANRLSNEEADARLLDKYLRAYRVFDADDPRFGWRMGGPTVPAKQRRAEFDRRVAAGTVVPLAIAGVKRRYGILAEDVDGLLARTRVNSPTSFIRFLPPLDNLLWRRTRLTELFGFDYTWEVYIPEKRRRYGYYAMPILAGDRLIGRLDPRLDRERGRLTVRLLHLDPTVRVTARLTTALQRALVRFARFHGVDDVRVARSVPDGLLRPQPRRRG